MNNQITQVLANAADWWRLYIQNAETFQSLIQTREEYRGLKSDGWDMWSSLISMDGGRALAMLQKMWELAPDNPIIHKWPGWDALCSLCSECEALDVDPIVNLRDFQTRSTDIPSRVREALEPFSLDLDQILSTGAIIAGGFIRDQLARQTPKDLDIYATLEQSIQLKKVLGIDSFICTKENNPEYQDSAILNLVSNTLRATLPISPDQTLKVQLITVTNPRAFVRCFDAYANMIYLAKYGLWSAHSHSLNDALRKYYEFSPIALSFKGGGALEKRAAKMLRRGWTVLYSENMLVENRKVTCCENEKRNFNGGCDNCGDLCL